MAPTTNQAKASRCDAARSHGCGRCGGSPGAPVAPQRGADHDRRRGEGGQRHAEREATEAEPGGREHEEVGEVRHRQEARRRVGQLRGGEQRRVGARAAPRDQRDDHRGEEHRGGVEAHEHGHQHGHRGDRDHELARRCGPAPPSSARGVEQAGVARHLGEHEHRGEERERGRETIEGVADLVEVDEPVATTTTAPVPRTSTSGTRPHATSASTAASTTRLAAVPTDRRPYPIRTRALDKSGWPDDVVAVLGGGQLGRMLALAGIPLDVRFRFLDPVAGAPAAAVGDLVVGALGDEAALIEVARGRDGRHLRVGRRARRRGALPRQATCPCVPGARSLEVAQDRLTEKETFRLLGIGTPAFAAVDDPAPTSTPRSRRSAVCPPCSRPDGVATTARGRRCSAHAADLDAGVDGARAAGAPLILESLVPFDRELSVLAVRGRRRHGRVLAAGREPPRGRDPARESRARARRRRRAAGARRGSWPTQLLEDLDHVGVLAVELFDVGGELLANEIAPRVHNSGHWTIEGAVTSQFENHVRAVLGWPLGSTAARGPSAMVNCIGVMPSRDAVLAIPGAHLHDYGKSPRAGRKLGHVTVIADDDASCRRASTR